MEMRPNLLFLVLQATTLVLPYAIVFWLGPGLPQGAALFIAVVGLFLASSWELGRSVARAASGYLVVVLTLAAMAILPNLIPR